MLLFLTARHTARRLKRSTERRESSLSRVPRRLSRNPQVEKAAQKSSLRGQQGSYFVRQELLLLFFPKPFFVLKTFTVLQNFVRMGLRIALRTREER